jgi:hypothetical protein
MRKMHLIPMSALIAATSLFTACQKADDLFPQAAVQQNDLNGPAFSSLDGGTLAGAQGSTEVQVLSEKPFTFQLNRFNNRKRLVWSVKYGVEAPYKLKDIQTVILPDQSIKVAAEVDGTAAGQQEVFMAHFDAMGELLWNTRAGTEAPVEILDKVEDPDFGSFVNMKEQQEDGSEVYIIVCFGPEGDPTFATGYAQGKDALNGHSMEDLGDAIQIQLNDGRQTASYIIDKKEGKVKEVIYDAGQKAALTGEGTAIRLRKASLRMQKIQNNQRTRP